MKIFNQFIISTIIFLGVMSNLSYATGNQPNIITEDKTNTPDMLNTLGATDIVDLSAYFTSSTYIINKYIIKKLPSSNLGTLYMADGTTAITINQTLSQTEADGLKFDPKESCSDATAEFQYAGVSDGDEEGTVGIVKIPLVAKAECSNLTVTSDNKNNPEMLNTLGAVDILNLSGKDSNGNAISRFRITSLPNSNQGVLYMSNRTTPVNLNQTLTLEEANGLKFDPNSNFVGDVTFTYIAISDSGVEGNKATVTIPLNSDIVDNVPTADDKNNPKMSNSLSAVDILNLSGKDSSGNSIATFIITSLPNSNQGILYMSDGKTPVKLNQTLTLEEANGLKFDPNSNFVGDVTFTYVAVDGSGVKSSNATVTIPLISDIVDNAPTADDKNNPKMPNSLSAVDILNLSGKDSSGNSVSTFIITSLPNSNQGILYMSDGKTPVKLNQRLTLEEANGLKFDPNSNFVGDVTFTYVAVDGNDVRSSNATVTIPLTISYNREIVTHNDSGVAHGSDPIVINVIGNDKGIPEGATVLLVNSDGTLTDEIIVGGGVWSVNRDNNVVFTPARGCSATTPSPINYVLRDTNGGISNTSSITITGECICEPYRESIPVFSNLGMVLMMLLSMIIGVSLVRKEII